MLHTILEEVKAKGFEVNQIIMDHNTSSGNIACSVFPEVRITYCSNYTPKSFPHNLMNIKSVHCKVKHKLLVFYLTVICSVITINSVHHHVRLKSVTAS